MKRTWLKKSTQEWWGSLTDKRRFNIIEEAKRKCEN